MKIHFDRTKKCIDNFEFSKLFVEELGWSRAPSRKAIELNVGDESYRGVLVAELADVVAIEIQPNVGPLPNAKSRKAIHKEISKTYHENLLIFIDRERTQSLWNWVKRQDGKTFPRDHLYCKGQPGDPFLGNLNQIVFDLSEFDERGNVSLVEVAKRLRSALDIEKTTKKFFGAFQEQHVAFLARIKGIQDERHRRWYASVLLNRLMFIYFLQKKPPGFLDNGNQNYLREKLNQSKERGKDRYYAEFLQALFFEGFAKPKENRTDAAAQLIGEIVYLNGGLFLPHKIEQENAKIRIPDVAFENLFDLFERYSWHLEDTPGGKDDEINPDVLGYIFEKYINQKAFGAYYTRPEITEYLCERIIHRLILDAINTPESLREKPIRGSNMRSYGTLPDLLMDLDAQLCKRLLLEVLPRISLLDPACGSGAFLVAAMKTLINIYSAIIGRIKFLNAPDLTAWLKKIESKHSVAYYIKKLIITDNLYGIDIMAEATEIARLRLFLALVASARTVDELEPLPNIDFNILAGNSLMGLMRVDEAQFENRKFQGNLFRKKYRMVLEEKNRLTEIFRHATEYSKDLASMRDIIAEKKREAYESLDDILLEDFQKLGIKYEEATRDVAKGKEGKPKKRPLKPEDIEALQPFHWGFEFDEILNKRGGFDAIITNPPWEILKPNGKEFFEEYSDVITKKNMTIHDFEAEQAELLKDADLRNAWLEYLSQFPHQSAYFRSAEEYRNQISVVNGKKAGTDINLYKLFVERCFHLLRPGGDCGIVIPSGIYTDLGAKQLREMLFAETNVTGLFGFENRKEIFEGVHRSFKFVVLTFLKGGVTENFPAAFMRLDVTDLDRFPASDGLSISVAMIKRLSPDSLSVLEFKSEIDVTIAEKMLRFPLLGEELPNTWNVKFSAEFHMTNDSDLFHTSSAKGRLPLYEGKMIHQFNHLFAEPRYWVDLNEGRTRKVGRKEDDGQELPYQKFRIGFRDVARNTDERTMIATVIPTSVFSGNTLITSIKPTGAQQLLILTSLHNSFVFDFLIRQRVTAHCNMFYVYQMPVPRLTEKNKEFAPIVARAAKLICTTPEYDELAKEVSLKSHKSGVTDPAKRAVLRAELDGLIAHLYGLTESEFVHILATFPLVPDPIKIAAHNAYRDVAKGLIV